MNRRIWAAAGLFILAMAVFGGCGKKTTEETEIALITNGDTIGENVREQSAWNGIEEFGKKYKKSCGYYVPDEASDKSYLNAIEEAVEQGAEVVVCIGEEFELAIGEAQRQYRETRFLLLDGVPRRSDGREKFRGNTKSIEVDRGEAGYLAGYAAVCSGMTRLGYLYGADEQAGIRYGTGFLLGAEAAAADLKLAEGAVSVEYWDRDTDGVSPDFLAEMEAWYEGGCQAVFTDGGSADNVVMEAAAQKGGILIGNEVQGLSQSCPLTVQREYGNLLYTELKKIRNDEFKGGSSISAGMTEAGISLVWNQELLPGMTETIYEELCKSMSSENFSVTGKDALHNKDDYKFKYVTVLARNGGGS